jgi:quercetin dioxygenase-like cupin family protein
MFPFTETKKGKVLIREFSQDVDKMELIWHRDKEDRTITILESKGWKLQMDNTLPVVLEEGKSYNIPKNTYHRVIKGEGKLILELEKHK